MVALVLRDALYSGKDNSNHVERADGTVEKVTSFDDPGLNALTAGISTMAGGALASAAEQNTSGGGVTTMPSGRIRAWPI